MVSTTICASCLRALRSQVRRDLTFQSISKPASSTIASPNGTKPLTSHQFLTSIRSYSQKQPPPPPIFQTPKPTTDSEPQNDTITNLAARVRQRPTFKSATEPYIAYGSTEDLFRACTSQCSYVIPSRLKEPPEDPPKNAAEEDVGEGEGWWYLPKPEGGLGLDVTFNTWAQVMFLHMYMLTVRLRCFPAEHARIWHQNLLDHFFYAAEDRMSMWHGMSARGVRNRYLKDLWQQWRGVLLSYDEGLIKGDATLATAVWRNVFKAGVETDVRDLAMVTGYLRSQLLMLDSLSDERVASGDVKFADPGSVRKTVELESRWMKKPVEEGELKAMQEKQSV